MKKKITPARKKLSLFLLIVLLIGTVVYLVNLSIDEERHLISNPIVLLVTMLSFLLFVYVHGITENRK